MSDRLSERVKRALCDPYTACAVKDAMETIFDPEPGARALVFSQWCTPQSLRDPDFLIRSRRFILELDLAAQTDEGLLGLMKTDRYPQFIRDCWVLLSQAKAGMSDRFVGDIDPSHLL